MLPFIRNTLEYRCSKSQRSANLGLALHQELYLPGGAKYEAHCLDRRTHIWIRKGRPLHTRIHSSPHTTNSELDWVEHRGTYNLPCVRKLQIWLSPR